MTHQVLLFYKYVTIDDPETLKGWVTARARSLGLAGRVIVAEEGINGTLEGSLEHTNIFKDEFLEDPRFSDVQVKTSLGNGASFPKLSVKVRDEIVGTRFDKERVDPRKQTARHLRPEELRSWYESQKDFVVVDMRNDYEFESGHFRNSINPKLNNSRDLPEALPLLEPLKNKTVLTVCTGGVRCEKMSAYLLSEGFADVYQLDNGIHGYMEKYPGKDYLGTLYTFDGRLTMDFGGDREIVGKCFLCGAKTESYVNCADDTCHLHFLACEVCQKEEGTFCSERCSYNVSVGQQV
ncbi:MAG: rhodanese-related sulfurtransferase [bacterium]|nr:rhodanese-related sulfurtransferase [bacterium]MDO8742728.1 rhodanese-related sulfurtransferase [bacterium]